MNFIFISPNFPKTYWNFCRCLKQNGVRVLGIGDAPYEQLEDNLKQNLQEYYKVSSLENYEEVYKALSLIHIFPEPYNDYDKLNHAHWRGGPELAIQTINLNFDMDITIFFIVVSLWVASRAIYSFLMISAHLDEVALPQWFMRGVSLVDFVVLLLSLIHI